VKGKEGIEHSVENDSLLPQKNGFGQAVHQYKKDKEDV
jgi:hypothetical protein